MIPKSRNTRYPMLENIESIDKPALTPDRDATEVAAPSRSDASVGIFASPEEPLTVDEIIERIHHRIPDQELRQIAVWLFQGHKMTGNDGIMKRMGLRKHQVERAMHRIRMLLAGEFGLSIANPVEAS